MTAAALVRTRCLAKLAAALALAATCCLTPGCSSSTGEAAYDPAAFQGEVDTKLSSELQAKQAALKTVLDGLMPFGVEFDALAAAYPSIRFTEPKRSFYGTATTLYGWSFRGTPTPTGEFPVTLYFAEDADGRPSQGVERNYRVLGGGQTFRIERAK